MMTCANVLGIDRRSSASMRLPYVPVSFVSGASAIENFRQVGFR